MEKAYQATWFQFQTQKRKFRKRNRIHKARTRTENDWFFSRDLKVKNKCLTGLHKHFCLLINNKEEAKHALEILKKTGFHIYHKKTKYTIKDDISNEKCRESFNGSVWTWHDNHRHEKKLHKEYRFTWSHHANQQIDFHQC